MNRFLLPAVGCAVVAALLASAAGAEATFPHRKPGMWQSTMTMAGKEISTGLCIDAATDAQMSVFGMQAQRERCGQAPTITPVPGGFAFRNECAGRVTSGTAIGDFNKAYTVTVEGKTHLVMNSRWVGPCPAGRKPGDMILPNGMVMNINGLK